MEQGARAARSAVTRTAERSAVISVERPADSQTRHPARIGSSPEPQMPEPATRNRANLLMAAILVLLAVVYAARIGPPVTYPIWGFDSSISVVSAKALSEGRGLRLINHPDAPASPYVPIGYPAMLALALRFVSLDAAGVTLLRGISLLTCLAFILLSYRLLRRYISPKAAAGIMFLVGFQPWVVVWAGELFTECPFAMWAAAAILLARRSIAEEPDDERRWWLSVAGAGVCIALAMMTRTIGFTLIAGLGAAFALNRKWRKMFVFGAATGLTMLPWLVWSALNIHGGNTALNYLSWTSSQYHWWTPFYDAWRMVVQTAPSIYFAPFGTPDGRLILERLHLLPIFQVLGVLISAVFLAGMVMLLKRRDVVACCLVCYLTVVLLYPIDPSRYLMPVYPLLAIPLITGLRPLWQRERFRIPSRALSVALGLLLAVMVLGSLITNSIRIANVYAFGHFYGARGAKDWSDLTSAFGWIRQNVPEDGVVVTLYSCSVYLFTDRLTISPYHDATDSKTKPASAERLEEVVTSVNPSTPLYIFARNFYMENEELSVAPLKGFISKYPERVKLRWETPDHKLMIYEVVQPGG